MMPKGHGWAVYGLVIQASDPTLFSIHNCFMLRKAGAFPQALLSGLLPFKIISDGLSGCHRSANGLP